jgi:hypothetical protein
MFIFTFSNITNNRTTLDDFLELFSYPLQSIVPRNWDWQSVFTLSGLGLLRFQHQLWKIYIRIIHNYYRHWFCIRTFLPRPFLYLMWQQWLYWIQHHWYRTLTNTLSYKTRVAVQKKTNRLWSNSFSRHALYLWFGSHTKECDGQIWFKNKKKPWLIIWLIYMQSCKVLDTSNQILI